MYMLYIHPNNQTHTLARTRIYIYAFQQLLDNHELANARKMMQVGYQDPFEIDHLAKRKMPIMPWMGGTGKAPTSEDVYNEARRRAGLFYKSGHMCG